MRTVALVTQKGGSGKSTLAASIAVEMQASGETVFLVDMDPQRSLATWARGRSDRRLAGAAIGHERLGDVLSALRDRAVTLAIIDTPGSLGPATDAAVLAADLILVPVRPTVFDVWSSETTWRRIRELGKDCSFVLNQCPTVQGGRRMKDSLAALDEMGGLLTPLVTARVDYQEAMRRGLGPTEVDPTGAAAEEVRGLCASLRRRLAPRRPARKPASDPRGDRAEAALPRDAGEGATAQAHHDGGAASPVGPAPWVQARAGLGKAPPESRAGQP